MSSNRRSRPAPDHPPPSATGDLSRRDFLNTAAGGIVAAGGAATIVPPTAPAAEPAVGAAAAVSVTLHINGKKHELKLDPRVTLLDALREHLGLTGTKKGCDHGQCGACTVLVNEPAHLFLPDARGHAVRCPDHDHRRAGQRRQAAPHAGGVSRTRRASSAATAPPAKSARRSACSTRGTRTATPTFANR